jgi:TRAP transporter TAXI family solute receptor
MRHLMRALALVVFWPIAAAAQGVLAVGTMAPGSLSYGAGSAIAEMMTDTLGLETRVQPHSGESTLLSLLDKGELDFAVANVLEASQAHTGVGGFAGRPLENLRVAATLFPLRVALYARADGPIRTVADLRGKRVTTGFSASAAIETLLRAELAGAGLELADVAAVPVANVVAGADQFLDGRVDAFFFAVGAAKVAEVDASVKLRMLALPDDPAATARVQGVFADAYVDVAPPAPGLVGVEGPTPALAFDNLLMTRADAPDAVVAEVVGALAAEREALVAAVPAFRSLDPARLAKPSRDLAYHPGAAAALN